MLLVPPLTVDWRISTSWPGAAAVRASADETDGNTAASPAANVASTVERRASILTKDSFGVCVGCGANTTLGEAAECVDHSSALSNAEGVFLLLCEELRGHP